MTEIEYLGQDAIRFVIGAAAGAASGCFLPGAVRALIRKKCEKRGRACPENIMSTKILRLSALAADALLSALAVGLLEGGSVAAALCMIQLALVCVFTDWYIRIIANETVVLMLLLALVYRYFSGGIGSLPGALGALGVVTALFGGCAALSFYRSGAPGVGAGDMKYAMALALAAGWQQLPVFLGCFAAAVLVYVAFGLKTRLLDMKSYFPMCLHLSLGLMGALFLPALGLG